jgi:DNA polymerase-3 subunit beta
MLVLERETGRVELACEQALKLLGLPLLAVSTERSKYYLGGVFLHDAATAVIGAATDGVRLVKVSVPGVSGLSNGLIAPSAAVKIIIKLLADKSNERITLRRSSALFAVEAPKFTFISKLIDATFPDYERVIPEPSGNAVTVERARLARALERVAAVADPLIEGGALVGLQWGDAEPALRLQLAREPGAADDAIDAEVAGAGRVAMRVSHARELADEFTGQRMHFDTNGASGPILVSDPDDPDVLTLQMPCAWPLSGLRMAEKEPP